jgi:hypothetical protein
VQVYRNTAPKMKYSAKNEIQCQKWHSVPKKRNSVPKNEINSEKMKYVACAKTKGILT